MKNFAFAACCGLVMMGTLSAQEVSRFAFDLGAGFTQPVGNTGRILDEGWNVQGGAGINFSSHLGAMLQLGYNSFGINSTTLNNIGFPGGDIHVFSATVDPIVHLNPHGHLDVYLIGGGGLYRRQEEFTAPSVATLTAFDPFFGAFYPVRVPTTAILSSYSVNKPGWNAGMGFALGTKWHGKVFAEARYVHIFMNGTHTDYVPVTFGYRW
jgi:Outer membrane protein beta-barrel domain